jgi:phosphopantothenoylcysteine decarboxylase/phosphopantothenate--cysteine ligase
MAQIFDDRDVEIKGQYLAGKTLDFVITGGVAAIESPRFIRELRRFGAEVRVWMTPSAEKFVSPLVFEWASKRVVTTELSGIAEHISQSDAVVVAPCTLNFLSKMALGIADTAAATLIQSAMGRMPVFIAPSMHVTLSESRSYERHRKSLAQLTNVFFLEPHSQESKLKMISVESAVAVICHELSARHLTKKAKAVVSLGPTRSPIDDVRYISNHSTGALGLRIADEFFRRGFDVIAVVGPIQVSLPPYLHVVSVKTNQEMKRAMRAQVDRGADIAVFAAAVLDFDVAETSQGKLSSKKSVELRLKPSPKLIDSIRSKNLKRVGFKLESGVSEKELLRRAQDALKSQKVDLLVANRLEDVSAESHRAYLLTHGSSGVLKLSSREEIAQALAVFFESKFKGDLSRKSSRRA